MRVISALCKKFQVAVNLLVSLLEVNGCAFVLLVHGLIYLMFCVPIANHLNCRIEIAANTQVYAIVPVVLALNPTFTAAVVPQLFRNEKVRKVLRELLVVMLFVFISYKRSMDLLVRKFMKVFAKSDAEVGTTSLTFHEKDTVDLRVHKQPYRRMPYN